MQQVLQILHIEHRDYKSVKSGKSGTIHLAQCIIKSDGEQKIGELMLRDEHKDLAPGEYSVEWALDTDFEKRVVARPVRFVPAVGAAAAVRAARVA